MAKASVTLSNLEGTVKGRLTLSQQSYEAPTILKGQISGLTPGQHAIAIHVFGDISEPSKLGGHFNPYGKNHGAPDEEERHVGSLGNIEVGENGIAQVQIEDKLVKLIGPQSVIGRSLVIGTNPDDLGKGGHEYSLRDGNAGEPVAMGVIGISM